MSHYRKVWKDYYGEIPKDSENFSYEIHHIDGNRSNNDITNLKMVTIREHLDIHLQQEDWFAAALIAKRIGLGPEYISNLQRGKKRPGVGGVKKGNIPWNRGKKGCFSPETIERFSKNRKGKRFCSVKVSDEVCREIIDNYNKKNPIEGVGSISKNGKVKTYEWMFAKINCEKYNVTQLQIHNIITGKRNVQK